jgi:hypothetical protein
MKACRWSGGITPCILNMEIVELNAPAGEGAPGAHCVGCWTGSRAVRENRKKLSSASNYYSLLFFSGVKSVTFTTTRRVLRLQTEDKVYRYARQLQIY